MTRGHGDDIHDYSDIRLNFSSNVYAGHDSSALTAYLAEQLPHLGHYPEPSSHTLEQQLAATLGLQPCQVMVTNGATEAIYLAAQAQTGNDSVAAVVAPTFSEYADACCINGLRVIYIGGLDDIPSSASMVWICNPNNPTGTVTGRDALLQAIRSHRRTLFVVDASYAPFTNVPLLSATDAAGEPNVLMLHSMTKQYAVPGLRIGYVTGGEEQLRPLRQRQMPWSVNTLAQRAGSWLVTHSDAYAIPVGRLLSERARVAGMLQATGLIDCHSSDTHILLCRLRRGTAAELKEWLATTQGILIRDASNFVGLTREHFRIAVGLPEENDILVNAITQYLCL